MFHEKNPLGMLGQAKLYHLHHLLEHGCLCHETASFGDRRPVLAPQLDGLRRRSGAATRRRLRASRARLCRARLCLCSAARGLCRTGDRCRPPLLALRLASLVVVIFA